MFRKLRILVLLLILLFVALSTWLDRIYTTDWDGPLLIALFPLNADDSDVTQRYLDRLKLADFADLEPFFQGQAERYGVKMDRPVRFTLTAQLHDRPPLRAPGTGMLGTMLWSLRLRIWSWGVDRPPGPTATIRLFLMYHDPERSPSLPHSVGLQKGLMGIAHLFADGEMAGANKVVIAHEFLHTLGATDKYDLPTGQPIYPYGYADPAREPRYPQDAAELMAGRIPISETQAEIPSSLDEALIGRLTATEIGWVKK